MLLFATTILALLATGVAWRFALRQQELRERSERDVALDRAILRAAMLRRGRITALDVDARAFGSVTDVEERLRVMYAHAYCDSEIAEDGRHLYVFVTFDDSAEREAAVQNQIFLLAKVRGGIVDLPRVAMATGMTYQSARAVLDAMVEDGICQRTGVGEYRFRALGLQDEQDIRASARMLPDYDPEPHSLVPSGDAEGDRLDEDPETGLLLPRTDRAR